MRHTSDPVYIFPRFGCWFAWTRQRCALGGFWPIHQAMRTARSVAWVQPLNSVRLLDRERGLVGAFKAGLKAVQEFLGASQSCWSRIKDGEVAIHSVRTLGTSAFVLSSHRISGFSGSLEGHWQSCIPKRSQLRDRHKGGVSCVHCTQREGDLTAVNGVFRRHL